MWTPHPSRGDLNNVHEHRFMNMFTKMFTNMFMNTCVYIYVHRHVCKYIYIHIYIDVHVHGQLFYEQLMNNVHEQPSEQVFMNI